VGLVAGFATFVSLLVARAPAYLKEIPKEVEP
jgi:hypothetical protein